MQLILTRILIGIFGWTTPYWIRARDGYEIPDEKKPLAAACIITATFFVIGITEVQSYMTAALHLHEAIVDISFGIIFLIIAIILYRKKRKKIKTKEDLQDRVIAGWVVAGLSIADVIMMGMIIKLSGGDTILWDFFIYGVIGTVSGVIIIIRNKKKLKDRTKSGKKQRRKRKA